MIVNFIIFTVAEVTLIKNQTKMKKMKLKKFMKFSEQHDFNWNRGVAMIIDIVCLYMKIKEEWYAKYDQKMCMITKKFRNVHDYHI